MSHYAVEAVKYGELPQRPGPDEHEYEDRE